jgi:hypothetical protein
MDRNAGAAGETHRVAEPLGRMLGEVSQQGGNVLLPLAEQRTTSSTTFNR